MKRGMVVMKCSIDEGQFRNRLSFQPEVMEIQLLDKDFMDKKRWELLKERIQECKDLGVNVYLHHPTKYKGRHLDILHEDRDIREFYKYSTESIGELCSYFGINCVIHGNYSNKGREKESGMWSAYNKGLASTRVVRDEIKKYEDKYRGVFLWENSIVGVFSMSNPYLYEEIIKPLGLNIVNDVSHAYISFQGDMGKTLEVSEKIDGHVVYFHIVDSFGKVHDSMELGKGTIDWELLLPIMKGRPYICEIGLENMDDALPMQRSYEYVGNILKDKEEEYVK